MTTTATSRATIAAEAAASADAAAEIAADAAESDEVDGVTMVVVDDDIDIEDSHEVLWAVSTRLRADEDITILKNLQGNLLDPSQHGYDKSSGFVMDATKPLDSPYPPAARVPAEAIDRFPLDRYTISRPTC